MKESPSSIDVTLIAAVSKDGYLSRSTGVPWDLPDDRDHFRAMTSEGCLLVGRRTYEEMLGWFKTQTVLVLTRNPGLAPSHGSTVANMPEALQKARDAESGLMVIGGGQVYALAMPWANRLIITRVNDTLGSGISFPPFDPDQWRLLQCRSHPSDQRHAHAFDIETWIRVSERSAALSV